MMKHYLNKIYDKALAGKPTNEPEDKPVILNSRQRTKQLFLIL